jgi:hypothetical protein
MKKLFLLGTMSLLLSSCDITDYFIDESGTVKHKDGTTVDQKDIDENAEAVESQNMFNPKVAKLADI